MKKILALFIAAVCFVGTSFALDFEVGAKLDLGKNLAEGETVVGTLQGMDATGDFQFGGSAYVRAAIFPFLGVQVEPTIFKSTVSLENGELNTKATYDSLTLDVPVMYWSGLKIWRLAVGAGVGINFSKDIDMDKNALENATAILGDAKDSLTNFAWGLVAGADAKVYVTKHIGIVGSLRYVMDLSKKTVPIVIEPIDGVELDTGKTYDTVEVARRFLYGSLGVEFKLF